MLARQLERALAGLADKEDPAEASHLGRNGQAQLRWGNLRLMAADGDGRLDEGKVSNQTTISSLAHRPSTYISWRACV